MGKFITQLKVEQVSEATSMKPAIWRLTEPLIYESSKLGLIIVDRGTETDFASIPRLPLAYLLYGGRNNAPAVLHDSLYSAQHDTGRGKRVTRIQADALFFEAIVDTMSNPGYTLKSLLKRVNAYLTAFVEFLFVRICGLAFWR